jgi:hypothetical protein
LRPSLRLEQHIGSDAGEPTTHFIAAVFDDANLASGHPQAPPRMFREGYITKHHLNVREAWEIGPNDLDGSAVFPDDDVMIPADRKADAPVLQLLKWKGENRKRNPPESVNPSSTEPRRKQRSKRKNRRKPRLKKRRPA